MIVWSLSYVFNSSLPSACIYASVNWVSIGSDNGLSLVWHQAITWTNTDLLSIEPLGTHFSEIWLKISNFSFINMHLKMLSVKWRPFCPGGDVLIVTLNVMLCHNIPFIRKFHWMIITCTLVLIPPISWKFELTISYSLISHSQVNKVWFRRWQHLILLFTLNKVWLRALFLRIYDFYLDYWVRLD